MEDANSFLACKERLSPRFPQKRKRKSIRTPPIVPKKVLFKAKGAFGQVTVLCSKSGRLVAIKLFFDPAESSCQEELEFVARHLLRRREEHLVCVLGVVPGGRGYKMEACMGGNLEDFINNRSSAFFPVELLHQIARGLKTLHVQFDAAHRDIKPANVVLDKRPDGRMVAKIADFGWIKMDASKSGPDGKMPMSMPAVTQPYRSPELLLWMHLYDPFAVDIWSFGVLCLECLIRARFLHDKNTSPTYATLVQVVLKVTGSLTESHFPTLMRRAAQGWCCFPFSAEPRKVKGTVLMEVNGREYLIEEEGSGEEHIYRKKGGSRPPWSIGDRVIFRQQNITPGELRETFESLPKVPRPPLRLRRANKKLRPKLVPLLRGMLEPDEGKRWTIERVVDYFDSVV